MATRARTTPTGKVNYHGLDAGRVDRSTATIQKMLKKRNPAGFENEGLVPETVKALAASGQARGNMLIALSRSLLAHKPLSDLAKLAKDAHGDISKIKDEQLKKFLTDFSKSEGITAKRALSLLEKTPQALRRITGNVVDANNKRTIKHSPDESAASLINKMNTALGNPGLRRAPVAGPQRGTRQPAVRP